MTWLTSVLLLTSLSMSSMSNPIISSVSPEQIKNIGENVKLNCSVDNVNGYVVGWAKSQATGSVVLAFRDSLTLNDKRYSVTEIKKNNSSSMYSFQINDLEVSDIGIYECQVIVSSSEKINAKINLLIKHAAYILENQTPESYTISEGSNAELTCQADGYPKPTISWKRENNAVMPTGGNKYHGNLLKLKTTHRSDRGIYFCIADNGMGIPDKKPIRLEVEFPPSVTVPRPKVAQVKTYSIELECNVEGYPAPSISWYKSGSALQSIGNYRISNIATANEITNSVLRIYSVGSSDFGDYFCNATNKLGYVDAKMNLFESVIPVPTNF